MKKIFVSILIITTLSVGYIIAQPLNTTKVSWEYLDADLVTYSITEFQIKYDFAGTWVSLGIPTDTTVISGGKTYATPLIVGNGPHDVSIRACNASLCSDPIGPLAFIKPGAGKNIKIIGGK